MKLEEDIKKETSEICIKGDACNEEIDSLCRVLSLIPDLLFPCTNTILRYINGDSIQSASNAIELLDRLFTRGGRLLQQFVSRDAFLRIWGKRITLLTTTPSVTKSLVQCLSRWAEGIKTLEYKEDLSGINSFYISVKRKGFSLLLSKQPTVHFSETTLPRTYEEICTEKEFLLKMQFRDLIKCGEYINAQKVFQKMADQKTFIETPALKEISEMAEEKTTFLEMLEEISGQEKDKMKCSPIENNLYLECRNHINEIKIHLRSSMPADLKKQLECICRRMESIVSNAINENKINASVLL